MIESTRTVCPCTPHKSLSCRWIVLSGWENISENCSNLPVMVVVLVAVRAAVLVLAGAGQVPASHEVADGLVEGGRIGGGGGVDRAPSRGHRGGGQQAGTGERGDHSAQEQHGAAGKTRRRERVGRVMALLRCRSQAIRPNTSVKSDRRPGSSSSRRSRL
jgi:hypothetical protein